jgi:hypothetical protein
LKTLLTILFLSFASFTGFSQKDSVLHVTLLKTFPTEVKDFTTDNLGNIYLLTLTNQIKKVNEKGDSIAVFNDVRRFGKISSIDASNPLKILVYYKDFSTVVVLDRLLNVRNTIDLKRQNILQVKAITISYDNNIWLYDELDSKIKKIDDNGRLLLESNGFRQVYKFVPSPTNLYDSDGQLYLYDPRKGLLVYDYYGAQKNSYPITDLLDVQVIDKNTITARDSMHIVLFKPASLQLLRYNAFKQQEQFSKIRFNGNRILCLSKEGLLYIYSTP